MTPLNFTPEDSARILRAARTFGEARASLACAIHSATDMLDCAEKLALALGLSKAVAGHFVEARERLADAHSAFIDAADAAR